jgi:mono/diheme cytochrome c family protein
MPHARFTSAAIVLLTAACASGSAGEPAAAPPPPAPLGAAAPAPGFYSSAQADRGRARYAEACQSCHPASQFRGADFEWRWRRQTAWELFDDISRRMPEDRPGALPADTYADIVAYLLSLNDYPAGDAELAPTREALAAIPLGAGADKTRPQE